ncbi:MAG: NAD synthetase [Acidobacteria bacterium]|nr:NAD synthetase [Acidobacteriota bacterium]
MLSPFLIDIAYIAAAVLFVFGLKMLSKADTAQRGNQLSSMGMLIALVATLLYGGLDYTYIVAGLVIGGGVGLFAAKTVAMTGMPEMVALFNGTGGIASLLVGWAEFHQTFVETTNSGVVGYSSFTLGSIFLASLIGGLTFTGSIVAWGKLSGKMPGRPMLFPGQQAFNVLLLLVAVGAGIAFSMVGDLADPLMTAKYDIFLVVVATGLLLGILAVIGIGGADMPVVIALLNSYSGLAACATGFIIVNKVLIVSGALVGASGLILTTIMCKAMNRSLSNVLFSGFGSTTSGGPGKKNEGEAKVINAEDAFLVLEAASSVVIVPGYGMAVAQAQHAVRELGDMLEENGCEVKYAIHPVAGRMPGHMNVLLAEANVPYEQLVEPDDVNPIIETVDVCMVIGANDVVNPAAREDDTSPIYGMPIIDVDKARTTFVLKRSLGAGYAGIGNPLFFRDNTRMLLGDAKDSVSTLVAEFKQD